MLDTVTKDSLGERLVQRIRVLIQKLTAAAHCLGHPAEKPAFVSAPPEPQILTVSADVSFYSAVLNAANSWGWRSEWARSMKRGVEICRSGIAPIVIYDRNLPGVDWHFAVDQLSKAASNGRVLVAAPEIDEDLWRTVLRRHGYDVLTRSAGTDEMKRELRFAWLSLQGGAGQDVHSFLSHGLGAPV